MTSLALLIGSGCLAPVGERVAGPFPTATSPDAGTGGGAATGDAAPAIPATPATTVPPRPSAVGAPGADPPTTSTRSAVRAANGVAPSTARRPGPSPACPPPPPSASQPVPPALAQALAERLTDPRLAAAAGSTLGASVWMEGYGEVVAYQADLPLLPASNQKLLTAVGALAVLPGDATFATTVEATGPVVDGVVQGHLVLVGGGDATVTVNGPHSLSALAEQLLAAGVRGVAGDIVGDESRHVGGRRAPGWPEWEVPDYAGPLSALMVEHNWHRDDPAFVADPALGNGELFREVLTGAGIAVAGGTRSGRAPSGSIELARLRSPSVAQLVGTMLLDSDNEVAELLTREAGLAVGQQGSTEAGTAALAAGLAELCLQLATGWADGSGMSRADLRTARELRALLHAASSAPGWPVVYAGLPLAGRSGTLAGRFVGTPAEGNVRAKTGYILEGRSLSGVLTTAGGRAVVFSILVNGPGAARSVDAIDELIVTLAADRS